MTLAQLAALPPTGGAPPLPAGPSAPAAPPPAARLQEDDEEGDDDEEDAARLAAEYTAAGLEKCPYHDRKHACPRCGVQRSYGLDPVTHAPRVAWRPMRRAKTAAVTT